MPNSNNTLCLDKFYPEKDLKITDIVQQKDNILIRMKSISKSCKCPKCNYFMELIIVKYRICRFLEKVSNLKYVPMSMSV